MKIRILPEILSNKIAAGEVVERPASVVKELVENAIDAAGTRIIIEIEKGGKSLIRISDNGTGMNRDNALLSLERYATSKIRNDDDLFSISTLGFRGEALPSIASVSRFAMETKDADSDTGTRIEVQGGTIRNVFEIGAPEGTQISVEDLFFNTPARRKFLKSNNTEIGHIGDIISSIALGHPQIHFRFIHNGKIMKDFPASVDYADRVEDVFGRDFNRNFHAITFKSDFISGKGWISAPHHTRSASKGLYIFVNGRFVKDRIIRHALINGYTGQLMKGKYPVCALFMDVPYDEVDVNVHPAKQEIRFASHRDIHSIIERHVQIVLRKASRPQFSGAACVNPLIEQKKNFTTHQNSPGISEKIPGFSIYKNFPDITPAAITQPSARSSNRPAPSSGISEFRQHSPSTAQPPIIGTDESFTIDEKKEDDQKETYFSRLKIIGQLHNTYILCETDGNLMLIDQHAAHERILFEKLKKQAASAEIISQNLIIPQTIELGYQEADILKELIPLLSENGLEIEHFGGNTFIAKSVPAPLTGKDLSTLVIEIVDMKLARNSARGLDNILDSCLYLMACHSAVRAGHPLTLHEIKALLKDLDACDNPSQCPHGRPTWISWSTRTIEKSFKRIAT